MSDFMKKACAHCPFRKDVTPFLTTSRAEEVAFNAANKYGSFTCHKTLDFDDDGDSFITTESKECCGHLTIQYYANGYTYFDEDGFKPDENCYEDPYDMVDAYEEENNKRAGGW